MQVDSHFGLNSLKNGQDEGWVFFDDGENIPNVNVFEGWQQQVIAGGEILFGVGDGKLFGWNGFSCK